MYDLTTLLSEENEGVAKELIKKHGGEGATDIRPFVKVNLAYPVEKKKQAFMAAVRFLMEPDSLLSLKEDLRGNSQILRHLILTVSKKGMAEGKAKKAERKGRKPEKREDFVSNKDLEEKIKEFE